MKPHTTADGRRPEGATGIKLVQLGDDGRGFGLTPGLPKELAPGVSLTLQDAKGNAMIERTPLPEGQSDVPVTIDGAEVFEIAHCRPAQIVRIGAAEFVVLLPYGVFVRQGGARKALADVHQIEGGARLSGPAAARVATAAPRRSGRVMLLAVPVAVAVAFAALAKMPVGEREPRHSAAEQTKGGHVKSERKAPKATVVEPAGEAVEAAGQVAAAPAASAGAAPAPVADALAAPGTASPVKQAPAATARASGTPVPPPAAPAAAPKSTEPRLVSAPASPDKAPPDRPAKREPVAAPKPDAKVDPAKEQTVRAQLESYQLDAGFDPEGARQKIRRLKAGLPAGSALARDLDRAIQGIRD